MTNLGIHHTDLQFGVEQDAINIPLPVFFIRIKPRHLRSGQGATSTFEPAIREARAQSSFAQEKHLLRHTISNERF